MLTPAFMRLERETLSWMDDDFFDLVERRVFEYVVDSPWTVPYFEVSPFSKLFREFGDFRIEGFFVCFILDFFDEVRRVVCLGSESITDLDSMRREDLSLWDLPSKSISSLRKDDLVILPCRLRCRDDELKASADTPIFIDREKYSIDSLHLRYDIHTEFLILETLRSTLEFGLFIIVHDDPDLIGTCLCARKFETLYVSWVDGVEIS